MNFTSIHNLQLIKNNLVDVFAEHLRYTVQDKTYEDKNLRKCLKCGEEFISESKFNRICRSCNKANAGIY